MKQKEFEELWFYVEKQMNKLEVSLNADKEMDNEVNRTKKRIWKKLHSLRFR